MALPSADEQRTLRKGMPFLSVRSFTLTNSELITKKTIYTKILTLPAYYKLKYDCCELMKTSMLQNISKIVDKKILENLEYLI